MKYQCCVCNYIFNSNQIVDNYKNGVKIGFLCPKCNSNIKDDLNGQTEFDRKAKGTYQLYALLIVIWFFDDKIEQYISNPLGINNWVLLGGLFVVLISIYAFLNRELLKEANTFTTKRVTHNNTP